MSQGKDSLDSWEGQFSKASYSCPVSGVRLDQRAVRLVAGTVVLLLCLYAMLGWLWIAVLLFVDFALRAGLARQWSPLGMAARWTTKQLGTRGRKMIDAAPKIFAARLGLAFSAALLGLHLNGMGPSSSGSLATYFVIAMFAVAAFLEAAFAFCLGCHVYSLLQLGKRHFRDIGDGI